MLRARKKVSRAGVEHRHSPIPPVELKKNDELVALEYLANGHNAAAAYRSVHPKCLQTESGTPNDVTLLLPDLQQFVDDEPD